MKRNKKKYSKPKIRSKKIKMSMFLTKTYWLDQLQITEQVYASATNGPESGGYPL
jgi:hypothetical protein